MTDRSAQEAKKIGFKQSDITTPLMSIYDSNNEIEEMTNMVNESELSELQKLAFTQQLLKITKKLDDTQSSIYQFQGEHELDRPYCFNEEQMDYNDPDFKNSLFYMFHKSCRVYSEMIDCYNNSNEYWRRQASHNYFETLKTELKKRLNKNWGCIFADGHGVLTGGNCTRGSNFIRFWRGLSEDNTLVNFEIYARGIKYPDEDDYRTVLVISVCTYSTESEKLTQEIDKYFGPKDDHKAYKQNIHGRIFDITTNKDFVDGICKLIDHIETVMPSTKLQDKPNIIIAQVPGYLGFYEPDDDSDDEDVYEV